MTCRSLEDRRKGTELGEKEKQRLDYCVLGEV